MAGGTKAKKKRTEDNKEKTGTYYLVAGMIRASVTVDKNEKSEGLRVKRRRVTKTGDDYYSCETKDEARRLQCERLNEFQYTSKTGISVYRTIINDIKRRRRSLLTGSPPI